MLISYAFLRTPNQGRVSELEGGQHDLAEGLAQEMQNVHRAILDGPGRHPPAHPCTADREMMAHREEGLVSQDQVVVSQAVADEVRRRVDVLEDRTKALQVRIGELVGGATTTAGSFDGLKDRVKSLEDDAVMAAERLNGVAGKAEAVAASVADNTAIFAAALPKQLEALLTQQVCSSKPVAHLHF